MSASTFIDAAEHSVTCPVCFEFYADPHLPKDLECPHTCCQSCLRKIIILNPGQPITCPMKCDKKTSVPEGGVEELRTNLHVKNLAEEHPNYVKGAKPAVPKCAKHGENMHLYCILCYSLACHSCAIAYHKSSEHVIVDVADKVEAQKKELKSTIENTKEEIQSCRNYTDELKTLESKIDTKLQDEKSKLVRSTDMYVAEINKEKKRVELELEKASEEQLKVIRMEQERVKHRAMQLQTAYDIVINTRDTSDHAYITQHADLVDKMNKITVKDSSQQVNKNLPSVRFGTFVTPEIPRRIFHFVPEFGDFKTVLGLAVSNDGLLAVCDKSANDVSIYQKHNSIYKKKLSLELNTRNALEPRGATFCPDGKLWVARWTGIEVYSPEGKYEKTISTKQANESDAELGVRGIAVTGNGDKVLAGDIKRNIITVHDPAGKILRTLTTNIRPCQMDVIKDTHVVIADFEPGKVSVIDMETGCETLSFDVPLVGAICYDHHTDSIFTGSADSNESGSAIAGTGKIEQYCWRTGRKIARIAQKLYYPSAMTMASDNTLVLGDLKSVKIFQIV